MPNKKYLSSKYTLVQQYMAKLSICFLTFFHIESKPKSNALKFGKNQGVTNEKFRRNSIIELRNFVLS